MKAKLLRISVVSLLLMVVLMAGPSSVLAKSNQSKGSHTCEQQVALINYRSEVLSIYKKSEDNKYIAFRKKWSTRINYAKSWVPQESQLAKDDLYKYDALHAVSDKELLKQIKAYKPLIQQPLNCTKAQRTQFAQKLAEVKGVRNKQVQGGNALISQNKKQETNFLNNDFKKSSDIMITRLHQEKAKRVKQSIK